VERKVGAKMRGKNFVEKLIVNIALKSRRWSQSNNSKRGDGIAQRGSWGGESTFGGGKEMQRVQKVGTYYLYF